MRELQDGPSSRTLDRGMALGSHAEILPTHDAQLFRAAIHRAAELLRAGQVVAVPTETVYGLAANALDAQAVRRIFAIKGRPAHNPVIVHVAGLEMARRCAAVWPESARRLAAAFWPGPLTLVLPRSRDIPDAVTAGGETVGIRWPGHPFIQELIRACGFPLAAPSANPSNQLSPTNAQHVRKFLGDRIALIVDGGQAQVGIESTVVDLTASPPRILRTGMVHAESLAAALAEGGISETPQPPPLADAQGSPLRSPGLLRRHYSPRARLVVLSWTDETDLDRQLRQRGGEPSKSHVIAHSRIPLGGEFARISVIPHDSEAFARALYAELHCCDELGAQWIVVESLPRTPEWEGIADRLRRAAESE